MRNASIFRRIFIAIIVVSVLCVFSLSQSFATEPTFKLFQKQSVELQKKLNKASVGDVVLLEEKTYYLNNITVPKGVSLRGVSKSKTVLNGGGELFRKLSLTDEKYQILFRLKGNSTISNLTIEDVGFMRSGAAIAIREASAITLENIAIKKTSYQGIWIYKSKDIILKNSVLQRGYIGLDISGSENVTVKENELSKLYGAINIFDSTCKVAENTFSKTHRVIGFFLSSLELYPQKLRGNTFRDNAKNCHSEITGKNGVYSSEGSTLCNRINSL